MCDSLLLLIELAASLPSCSAAWTTSPLSGAIVMLKGCMCELRSAIVGSAAGAIVAMARSGRDTFAAKDVAARGTPVRFIFFISIVSLTKYFTKLIMIY